MNSISVAIYMAIDSTVVISEWSCTASSQKLPTLHLKTNIMLQQSSLKSIYISS